MPKVLVLEDSPIIALDIEEELKRLGFAEVAVALDVETAMACLDEGGVGCALLDYSLGDATADDVAVRLRADAIPFAWISGRAIEDENDEPVLEKPFTSEEMAVLIARLVGEGRREAG